MNNSIKISELELVRTTQSVRVSGGEYGVNRQHLVITEPHEDNIADITEEAIAAGQVLKGRNIAIYGMAALVDDSTIKGRHHLAPNATLVNEGIIEIHLRDMVQAYKDKIKSTPDSETGIYRFIKCFAMAAGKDSLLINDGIIRVYFDQELESDTPVYGETLLAGENSTIINNGTIELVGNGSYATQARGIAVPANNMTLINKGSIKLDMERASTIRILATTGLGGSILNFGTIDVKSAGRIMTVARFANTHILNEGTIRIVSRATYIENKVSFLYQSYPLACAFYEHSLPNVLPVPPIVNNGEVYVHLEGSNESTPYAVAFGIYSEMVGKEEQVHRMENTGRIVVSQSGPIHYTVAELGVNVQSAKDFPYVVQIGEWHTTARDFASTQDLFVCGSGLFDFNQAKLVLHDSSSVADPSSLRASDLVCQTNEAQTNNATFQIWNDQQLNITVK